MESKGVILDIHYSKQASKFLQKQDAVSRERIINAIHRLPTGDVKKLQGEPGYRLRVGDYRVIFDRDGNVLMIIKIDSRGQIYK
jgi:mRNA interferase RelE/StbE